MIVIDDSRVACEFENKIITPIIGISGEIGNKLVCDYCENVFAHMGEVLLSHKLAINKPQNYHQ